MSQIEGNIVIFKDPNPFDELNFGWILGAPHIKAPLEFIADKRVPNGVPYKIVTQSLLPENFWNQKPFYTFDFSEPDGFGSGSFQYEHNGETYMITASFTGSYEEWKEVHNV